jgi:hypothetical protein
LISVEVNSKVIPFALECELSLETAYTNATEDRDYAEEVLADFKGQFTFEGEWDDFAVNLNADQLARFEELDSNFAEADTAYNLASVAMQNENAAEVAKAKEAARAALEAERAEKEIDR